MCFEIHVILHFKVAGVIVPNLEVNATEKLYIPI